MRSREDLVARPPGSALLAGGAGCLLAVAFLLGLMGVGGASQAQQPAAQIAPNHTMSGHVSMCVRPTPEDQGADLRRSDAAV